MDALWNALQQGGIESWLILIGVIVLGVIVLRIVFEIADMAINLGCMVVFILAVGWLLYTIFGS